MPPARPGAVAPSTADSDAAILIVDDNPGKRMSIGAVVAPLGHPTVVAESGEAALREVMKRSFAVILMDVQMPGMDGYETARLMRMRVDSEHTPIIFITAHTNEETQIPVAYASGAVDFIFAPVVPDILRAKVSVFVELFLKSRQLEESLTEVTALSERFRDSEAKTRSVLDNVADGIVTFDEEGLIQSFNWAASNMSGYAEEEACGRHFSVMLASKRAGEPASREEASKLLNLREGSGRPAHTLGRRKDGSTFPIELALSKVHTGTGTMQIACVRDSSERQIYTETLQYNALHDDLTDLPNRVLFGDRVNIAIRAAIRNTQPVAILLLDLNGFKNVNDTLGHECGDVLLKLVAKRIVSCLRDGDTVARLGGDEFGILLLGATDLAGAASVAWKLGESFAPSFLVEGHDVDISASIGIAIAPDHGEIVDDVLRRADLAMYEAKRRGTGHAVFSTEQEDAPALRLALLTDLRHCVERDELVLYYQPKIDLATRRTIGVEALIRWNHPSRGLLMPGDFMSEVEGSEHLLLPLTEWVITEAMQQLSTWRGEGYDLTMAVNIGARSLTQGSEFLETVEEIVSRAGVPPEALTLELTEGALLDTTVPELLTDLEETGQRLSIDDFGTGYSSLVYLQRLPVVEIKIDRTFVTPLASNGSETALVRSIIDLAHNLSLTVVAEGVEDEESLQQLIEFGCDTAQGFYFSRAVPADELESWLASSAFGALAESVAVPAGS